MSLNLAKQKVIAMILLESKWKSQYNDLLAGMWKFFEIKSFWEMQLWWNFKNSLDDDDDRLNWAELTLIAMVICLQILFGTSVTESGLNKYNTDTFNENNKNLTQSHISFKEIQNQ